MTHPALRVMPNGPVGRKLQHFEVHQQGHTCVGNGLSPSSFLRSSSFGWSTVLGEGGIDNFVYGRFQRTCSYRRRASIAGAAASQRPQVQTSCLLPCLLLLSCRCLLALPCPVSGPIDGPVATTRLQSTP